MNLFETSGFMIFAFIGLFVFVIVMILLPFIQQRRRNNSFRSQIVNAQVITKTTHLNQDDEETYLVTFQIGDDEYIEFFVEKGQYDKLSKGDCGELTFQDEKYIEFEKLD